MLTYELDIDSDRKALYIKGPEGAVQFVCMVLPDNRLLPADVGYHSPTPRYEDQYGQEDCHLLDGPCYYDGSTLSADSYLRVLLEEGDQAVLSKLAGYYNSVFETDHAAPIVDSTRLLSK